VKFLNRSGHSNCVEANYLYDTARI
jgi:hypothetical protein